MAVPPVRGQPYTFCLGLSSQANNGLFQDSPTIAPGDVVVVRDTTVLGNITTLPSALAGCTRLVQATVSADEMDGDQIYVLFHDTAGDEWKDVLAIIDTAAQTLDTIDINIDAILADTGTDGVVLANDAITSAKFDESTAFPLKAADAGSTYIARTGADSDTLETLSDQLDAVEPADVWAYSSRTLTQSAASVASAVAGSVITITRGDTLSASLTNIGALTGYVSLDFTVKKNQDDTDANAILRIRKNASGSDDGLITINKATAATAANGSITIDDAATGDITIALAAEETDDLVAYSGYFYDVQMITATAVTTLTEGICNVAPDVTRAVA